MSRALSLETSGRSLRNCAPDEAKRVVECQPPYFPPRLDERWVCEELKLNVCVQKIPAPPRCHFKITRFHHVNRDVAVEFLNLNLGYHNLPDIARSEECP